MTNETYFDEECLQFADIYILLEEKWVRAKPRSK
jgi:hypothetical protein